MKCRAPACRAARFSSPEKGTGRSGQSVGKENRMGFEDKRRTRQKPSMEFKNVGREPDYFRSYSLRDDAPRGRDEPDSRRREPPARPAPDPGKRRPSSDRDFHSYTDRNQADRTDRRVNPADTAQQPVHRETRPPAKRTSRSEPAQQPRKKRRPPERNPRGKQQARPPAKGRPKKQAPARPVRKLKPQVKRFFTGIIAALALTVVLGMVVFLVFKIDQVTVVGESPYTLQEVTDAAGYQAGDNLVFASMARGERRIQDLLPYIDSVKIRRRLPGTVEISVTPMNISISIQSGESWAYTNAGGKVAEVAAEPAEKSLQVTGLDIEPPEPGRLIATREDAPRSAYIDVIQTLLQADLLSSCRTLELADLYNIKINYEDRIQIKLGSAADLAYKLQFAVSLIQKEIGPEEQGSLDVSSVKENNRGIFTAGTGQTDENASANAAAGGKSVIPSAAVKSLAMVVNAQSGDTDSDSGNDAGGDTDTGYADAGDDTGDTNTGYTDDGNDPGDADYNTGGEETPDTDGGDTGGYETDQPSGDADERENTGDEPQETPDDTPQDNPEDGGMITE